MKKQIVIKIIGGAIIFSFALFFLQVILPLQANAANELNWENPNKSGNNPYKFKPQSALNSQVIMQVVGCTGIVDKVSTAVTRLFQKNIQPKIDKLEQQAVIAACDAAKSAAAFGASFIMNTQVTPAIISGIDCGRVQTTTDPETLQAIIDAARIADSARKTTECFNGIAMTLAKNQLTAMTRYTMNWINTGFNGDPMYVQNITSLTNGIEKGVLETGIAVLTSPSKAYPYGADFSRSMVNSYQSGVSLRSGATNFLDSLTSDLSNFVTDPRSYYSENALERANNANNAFANDFSTGGWNAWLALTQRDQNNPLGFAMQISQYEADQQAAQLLGTQNELLQNNGFLSQKKCVKYSNPDGNDPDAVKINTMNTIATPSTTSTSSLGLAGLNRVTPNTSANAIGQMNIITPSTTSTSSLGLAGLNRVTTNKTVCLQWEVVTPGSIIKDQLSNFVNSPVRQIELAKTINDSLNSVFSALISKLQGGGLAGLAASKSTYVNDNIGVGLGSGNTDLLGNNTSISSGYTNGTFDLTRDLGNTYIYNYPGKAQGDWNAQTNIPELNIGVSPLDNQGNPLVNVYYGVSAAGNTKIISDGYNGWAKGDRAFWNGSVWQNWKKGTANPVNKRGVIQIQKDYIVASKELLANMPNIMPKIGELEYCIPGPNPNWQANSSDAYGAFSDYAYSLTSNYQAGGFLKRDTIDYQISQPGQTAYDNYKKLFTGTNIFSGSLGTNARETPGIGTVPSTYQFVTSTPTWLNLNSIATVGPIKQNRSANEIATDVNDLLTKIGKNLEAFNTEYALLTGSIYGANGIMQKQFIERENTPDLIPNTGWLPMASDGLNITKDIINYASDIKDSTTKYQDDIIQANSNIAKLDAIKKQVSLIIKDAQTRRNANLIRILNEEATRNKTPVLTEAAYNKKYAACLSEEDIAYYDSTSLVGSVTGETGRCHDGIDNDLNGLIDARDPACQ